MIFRHITQLGAVILLVLILLASQHPWFIALIRASGL